jgi:RNA polymerase sigma-70 factor (ECF subfamily)
VSGSLAFVRSDVVRAAKTGDRQATEALLQSLGDELLPLACALAGASGADELVGDTLSRVYERLGQLRDDEALVPWARAILVRTFRDGIRLRLRRPAVRIHSQEVPVSFNETGESLDLARAVDRLPRDLRALLVLRYWEGYTVPECARALEIPEGTAKSRLFRAHAELREVLGEGYRGSA